MSIIENVPCWLGVPNSRFYLLKCTYVTKLTKIVNPNIAYNKYLLGSILHCLWFATFIMFGGKSHLLNIVPA